jgi:hypothetical protein
MLVSVITKLLFYGDRGQCLYALADQRRATVDQAGIQLHQTRPGEGFGFGIRATQDPTDANDWDRIAQLRA